MSQCGPVPTFLTLKVCGRSASQELYLESNLIEEISEAVFNQTRNLNVVALSHNRLDETRIAPMAWISLRSDQWLVAITTHLLLHFCLHKVACSFKDITQVAHTSAVVVNVSFGSEALVSTCICNSEASGQERLVGSHVLASLAEDSHTQVAEVPGS